MLEFITALDVKQPRTPKNIQKSANQGFADLLFLRGQEEIPFAETIEIEEQELFKEKNEKRNHLPSLENDKTLFESQQILEPEAQTTDDDIGLKGLYFQTNDDAHKLITEKRENVRGFIEQDDKFVSSIETKEDKLLKGTNGDKQNQEFSYGAISLQTEIELDEPTAQKKNEGGAVKSELTEESKGAPC
ncbi:hypothetical protein [Bacillus sp. JCM 19041]|uniref:hypothetical protein n=1 Tax=Bacillus sp. JCM 19041 TaxID=1460637 RepID=UPI0006CFE122